MPKFSVQGWEKTAAGNRSPDVEVKIYAQNGFEAASAYARMRDVADRDWNDGSPSPRVVIRVTDLPCDPLDDVVGAQ